MDRRFIFGVILGVVAGYVVANYMAARGIGARVTAGVRVNDQ